MRITALSRSADRIIALGLLTTAVLQSPPRRGALSSCILIALVVTLTAGVLHALRRAEPVGGTRTHLSPWARAATALGITASMLMILDATLAVVG